MLLGLEGKRVDVDGVDGTLPDGVVRSGSRRIDKRVEQRHRAARVVLERLDLPEVVAVALVEAVLAVELDTAAVHNVVICKRLRVASEGRRTRSLARRHNRATRVEVRRKTRRQRAVQAARILEHPHQLLDGVVQRQVQAGRLGRDGLGQGVLQLLNQVLVRVLGEAAALIRVQVDVVNVDGRILRGRQGRCGGRDARPVGARLLRRSNGVVLVVRRHKVRRLAEPHVEVDIVVLESDEGQGKTRVAVEPEAEGDVQHLRTTVARDQRGPGTTRRATEQLVRLADLVHRGRQALPQIPPLAVVTVNDLSTNLHLNLLEQEVAEAAHTARGPVDVLAGTRHSRPRVGQRHLEIRAVDKVSVAVHDGHHALAILGRAREVDTHGLHGEIGVTLVHDLPEGDVGVARDVGILCSVGNELEKTATHCVYLLRGYILLRLNNEGTAGRHVLSVREEGQEDLEGSPRVHI